MEMSYENSKIIALLEKGLGAIKVCDYGGHYSRRRGPMDPRNFSKNYLIVVILDF